jgi:hypothetical protein
MKLFTNLIKNNIFQNQSLKQLINYRFLNNFKFCQFSRSISKLNNDNSILKKNIKENKIEETQEMNIGENKEDELKENVIKFEKDSIDIMISILSKRSKYYAICAKKPKFEKMVKYYNYYNYIVDNIDFIEPHNLGRFIKSISLFQYKDDNTEKILMKLIEISNDELKKSATILNALSKLDIKNQDFINKCIEMLERIEFTLEDKTIIVQIANSITYLGIDNQRINSKIDEFIRINYSKFEETELTLLFRYNCLFQNPNYDVLDYLVKRSLELVDKFSIKTIILISKNLSELNFKNLVLFVQLRIRLNTLLDINNQNRIEELNENVISPNELCQVLNYFVRLNFLEPADYINLENTFFIYAAKYGINKDTTSTIIATHCRFMRKMIVEEREENGGKILMKTLRRYKY